jgi:hypothetical protein
MKASRFALAGLIVLLFVANLTASGPMGVYAIVDKVVFEPSESAPERAQVWGAFTFVDTSSGGNLPSTRGYLYFRLPASKEGGSEAVVSAVKKEWMDLKSVAGSGQAVAFGSWRYTGALDSTHYYTKEGAQYTDLRIRPESEIPASPAAYTTNVGVVKLDATSHASVIDGLKQAPKR